MLLYNNMDKDLNTSFDENFEYACELSEKEFSHEELLYMLESENVAERQIAALKFDRVTSEADALALINSLTGCDGKIREAAALRINQIIVSDMASRKYFNFPHVFADATIDINANICRLVVDSVKLLQKEENFSHLYVQKILDFTNNAFEELDKFIFRDKKYVINKQLFKLYWCLETLQNFYEIVDENVLRQILEKCILQKEYTIREKAAQIIKLSGKYTEFYNVLKNDENYYVRTILN